MILHDIVWFTTRPKITTDHFSMAYRACDGDIEQRLPLRIDRYCAILVRYLHVLALATVMGTRLVIVGHVIVCTRAYNCIILFNTPFNLVRSADEHPLHLHAWNILCKGGRDFMVCSLHSRRCQQHVAVATSRRRFH